MSKMRSALAGLAAVGVLAGGVAIVAPAQASTTQPVARTAVELAMETAAIEPGDLCWVKHDQAPVYHGPSLDSGIKEFLGRSNNVAIGAIPNLVEVLHSETGHRIGYMQQADLHLCLGPA